MASKRQPRGAKFPIPNFNSTRTRCKSPVKLTEPVTGPVTLEMVQLCARYAHAAHKGQTRRTGEPYITHPRAVAERFSNQVAHNHIYRAVAWLHDVLEDCKDIDAQFLLDHGVNKDVVDRVVILTKRDGEDYSLYLARVIQDPVCRAVKTADILHNLSCDPTLGQTRKYAAALLFLSDYYEP